MPKIEEFNGGNLALRPNDAAVEGAVQAGRRIGAFSNQTAQGERIAGEMTRRIGGEFSQDLNQLGTAYEAYQARQEISHGMATFATGMNNLSQGWNATAKTADPNDPTVSQKFHDETVQPWVDQFVGSFKTKAGQRWAQEKAAELTTHMYEKSAADMSTLAGEATIQNMEVAKNQFSQMTMNDPSSHDVAQQSWRDMVETTLQHNPNLTADQAARIREHYTTDGGKEIAAGAFYGVAGNNPGLARQMLADGKWGNYFDADQVKVLDGYAQTVQRANDERVKAAEAQQRKQEDDEAKAALGQAQAGMVDKQGNILPDPNFYKNLTTLMQMPGIQRDPSGLKSLIEMANTARDHYINHTNVNSDPQTYINLSRNVNNGLSASQINDAYSKNLLSDHDFNKLQEMVAKADRSTDPAEKELTRRRTEFLDSIKTQMGTTGPLGTFLKPEGAQRFYQFQVDTQQKEDALRAAGKSPVEIMDTLYNPRHSSYQGAAVGAYSINTKEGAAIAAAAAAGKTVYMNPPDAERTRLIQQGQAPLPTAQDLTKPTDQNKVRQSEAMSKLSPAQQAWIKAHP